MVRTNEGIICPGRTHPKKDPLLRGAPKNIAAPPAKTLLTREAGRGPGLARLADDCSRRAKAVAEIQWRRTLPSTHHPPPPPAPPSSRTTPAARPLSSDELSQRPETQDGHCRDAAAAGRRPGRGHSGKGRPRPSGHGKHQRRLADRCLSRGVVATSTRSSSTRSTTSRVHVPQHGSPSGCRR